MAMLQDTIRDDGEVCDCTWCSFPLEVGDPYYLDTETDLPYCCLECHVSHGEYIRRQMAEVDRYQHMERIRIPGNFSYAKVHGLSNELREKLSRIKPASVGQASRVDGITPAALSALMVTLKVFEKKI